MVCTIVKNCIFISIQLNINSGKYVFCRNNGFRWFSNCCTVFPVALFRSCSASVKRCSFWFCVIWLFPCNNNFVSVFGFRSFNIKTITISSTLGIFKVCIWRSVWNIFYRYNKISVWKTPRNLWLVNLIFWSIIWRFCINVFKCKSCFTFCNQSAVCSRSIYAFFFWENCFSVCTYINFINIFENCSLSVWVIWTVNNITCSIFNLVPYNRNISCSLNCYFCLCKSRSKKSCFAWRTCFIVCFVFRNNFYCYFFTCKFRIIPSGRLRNYTCHFIIIFCNFVIRKQFGFTFVIWIISMYFVSTVICSLYFFPSERNWFVICFFKLRFCSSESQITGIIIYKFWKTVWCFQCINTSFSRFCSMYIFRLSAFNL